MPVAASTRERLIEAATEVFSEQGYDGARVQDIARRAGLTTGAIYSRFRDKAELLLEAIQRTSGADLAELLQAGALPRTDDLLTAIGRSLITSGASTKDALLLEALVAGRRDPEASEMIRTNLAEHSRQLASVFVYGKGEGVVDPAVPTESAVTFCLALAVGLLVFRCLDVPMPAADEWSALVRRLVTALAIPKEVP